MEQIRRVVELVGDVLGPEVVGSYLHGSAVLGGLRPASDLDVLVVSRRSMVDRERRMLLTGLSGISGFTDGARPVELTVVVQSDVRPWRYPPTGDFLYGEWLREELAVGGPPRPEPMPDLALLLTMVLAGDHPLTGPPPARVLDPVPHADLVRSSAAGIPALLDDLAGDTRNVLLTLVRIWSTLATGEIRAKDAAADWALTRLPPEHRPVLAHVRELYLHRRYTEEDWSHELTTRVRPFVAEVLSRIDLPAPR
ncbi:aminoglycoside adenylyltransferase family protein [Streptomyces sp. NPDC018031]|uniref:aminoglycoside adenylyltransferase family protein n=1 Tax=Streptomyces sp. NPDC018031 TaxID=3365033 RepID=UPI0037A0FE8E